MEGLIETPVPPPAVADPPKASTRVVERWLTVTFFLLVMLVVMAELVAAAFPG